MQLVQIRRPGRITVTIVACAFAAATLAESLTGEEDEIRAGSFGRGTQVLVAAVLCAIVGLVVARERLGIWAPLSALILVGLAGLAAPDWVLDSGFVFVLVMVLAGIAGAMVATPAGYAGLAVVWLAGTLAVIRAPDAGFGKWLLVLLFMTTSWGAGVLMRRPLDEARAAAERADRLEREQELAAHQAVSEERRRIARELHDVIAHSVSVMTVQAGAVRRMLSPEQERERDALLSVESVGRDALTEMRRLVGLLKDDGDETEYVPQPGLGMLAALIGTVRDAGLPVVLAVDGEPRELAPGVDLAAYRVIQEALTNALRYAGEATASVSIRWSADELQLEVENDGRDEREATGGGHGLAGMEERVALYGGRVDSGPLSGGGYVVRAFLPIGGSA